MIEYNVGPTLLRIENVSLEYNGRSILKGVNAEIKDITRPNETTGQVVGFLGPSGIGKTQLFRIMAGLTQPTSGRVSINGFDRPVRKGEVGVVFQSYPLYDHRTVYSNLMLAANQTEKDPKTARDRVISYIQEFDLADVYKLYPSQLSGGQRQRCSIIQQILCSEHFLLLDEPFSGLDLLMLEKTCSLLSKIANRDDLNTIIIVTHDVTAAASISDHLWLMGRDTDPDGRKIPGARIIKSYDLLERGNQLKEDLCYRHGLITSPALMDLVREIKEEFRNL